MLHCYYASLELVSGHVTCSSYWNLSWKNFLSPCGKGFDIHSWTGVYLFFSIIYVYICRGIPDHTSDNQETLKKVMKIKERNPEKMPKILSTSNIQKRVSICLCLLGSYIHDRRCQILSEAVFKKHFLWCAPLVPIACFHGK